MKSNRTAVKFCRHCGRMIPLDSVDCPYCGGNTIRRVREKECPFCGELIRQKAVKCKHCGEFLDGRPPGGRDGPHVVYVDKAVISGPLDAGSLSIRGVRQVEGTEETPEAEHQLAPPGQKQLPAPEESDLPAPRPSGGPPAQQEAPREGPPAPAPPEEEAPPVQIECPSCRHYVYEDDNFCENCGRNLGLPREEPEIKGISHHYEPADYALMLGTAAPVGLVFAPVGTLVVAGMAAAVSAYALWRIRRSRGTLEGTASAAGGLGAALFWALMTLAFT